MDYGKHETILQSPYITLAYHSDVAGPVPPGQEHTIFNSLTAPQWGLDMVCNTATIVYGPWADRQRNILHKFFYPPDYQEAQVHRPMEGSVRQCASFNLNITFNRDTTFRIPFREMSKDQEHEEERKEREPAWIEIKTSSLSTFHYVSPLVATRPSGSTVLMDIILNACTVTTSLTNTPFLECTSFVVRFF